MKEPKQHKQWHKPRLLSSLIGRSYSSSSPASGSSKLAIVTGWGGRKEGRNFFSQGFFTPFCPVYKGENTYDGQKKRWNNKPCSKIQQDTNKRLIYLFYFFMRIEQK